MNKIIIDSDRLDLLLNIVDLSGYCILKNGKIGECTNNLCDSCVFCDGLYCSYDSDDYKRVIDWLKGE